MHYNENNPSEVGLGHRLEAQLKLAELMGIDEAHLMDWLEKRGGLFADLEKKDPDIQAKISAGQVDDETIAWIRDQMTESDTGDEDHDDEESSLRAA